MNGAWANRLIDCTQRKLTPQLKPLFQQHLAAVLMSHALEKHKVLLATRQP